MELIEFLDRVFSIYPPKLKEKQTVGNITDTYLLALDTGRQYDYENALKELVRIYDQKTLPLPSYLYKLLEKYSFGSQIKKEKDRWQAAPTLYGWCERHKQWYEFAVCEEQTDYEVTQALVKKGFTDITNQKPKDYTVNERIEKEKEKKCA